MNVVEQVRAAHSTRLIPTKDGQRAGFVARLRRHLDIGGLFKLLTFLFYVFTLVSAAYTVVQTALLLADDIRQLFEERRREKTFEIASCRSKYTANHCGTFPAPLLEEYCTELQLCILRDPNVINRISLVGEYIAQGVNSFISNVSWAALIFIAITFGIWSPMCYRWVRSGMAYCFGPEM